MDQLCRLCLAEAVEMACKLCDESKILYKLSCLNIQIHINDYFPSCICRACFKIIDDFQKFVENVKENEIKLIKRFNDGVNLHKSYESLTNRNVSEEKIKIEDEDMYTEPVSYELEVNVPRKTENNLEDIPQILTNTQSHEADKNTLNTNIPKPKTKIKRSSHSKQIKNAKIKKGNKLDHENSIVIIRNNIQIDNPFICNIDLNTTKLDSINKNESNVLENKDAEIKITEHKCLSCFEYLISNSELIKHYKTVHSNNSKTNNDKNKSNIMINNSSDVNTDVANKMDSILLNSDQLYNCKICGHTFTNVYGIIRHGRAHTSPTRYCSHGCGYSSVYNGALRDHEKRHENSFKYKCATCGAGFHVKTWHDQHQNVHKNVKPFVCDVCGTAFHMHRYLTSHRTSVHPGVWKGSKKYICPHCDLAFFNVLSYKAHLEEHTGKKRFLCDLCGKVCTSVEQLKYHNNAHLGLKPYTCSVCNKKFAKKFNLTVHEKAHSGDKHLCQTCGKYFAQRSTMLRHSRRRHPEISGANNSTGVKV